MGNSNIKTDKIWTHLRSEMTEDFFGKAVHGDITHYTNGQEEQHDPAELINLLDALLAVEHVQSVRWHQYTPYFNDGDACVFNVHQPAVKLDFVDEDEEVGDYEDNYLSEDYLYDYSGDWRDVNKTYTFNGVDTKEIYDALSALSEAMPHHTVVLQRKFGDPAEIIYDGESFNVEFYEHD
jgi:hypothetical protein